MITRKLTNSIRLSIARSHHKETLAIAVQQRDSGMRAYIKNTPQDVLDIMQKYPGLIPTSYVPWNDGGDASERYCNYGNLPAYDTKYHFDKEDSAIYLSLSSLSTFEEVGTLFPGLVKYLPQ